MGEEQRELAEETIGDLQRSLEIHIRQVLSKKMESLESTGNYLGNGYHRAQKMTAKIMPKVMELLPGMVRDALLWGEKERLLNGLYGIGVCVVDCDEIWKYLCNHFDTVDAIVSACKRIKAAFPKRKLVLAMYYDAENSGLDHPTLYVVPQEATEEEFANILRVIDSTEYYEELAEKSGSLLATVGVDVELTEGSAGG